MLQTNVQLLDVESGTTIAYVLDGNEVRLNERQVIHILVLEHADNSRVVNPWSHDREQIIDEQGCFGQIECQGLVHDRLGSLR